MHPTKAPGADGFPALFYQRFWDVIGDDVAEFYLQILHGLVSPGIINHTMIVLIPKVKKAVNATQFRPISLCIVLFNIVTKVIANRLKNILPDLICESQSAFVPGRMITDNALISYECFHFMKKRTNGRNGTMAPKLDMSKAYDRIEWSFLSSENFVPNRGLRQGDPLSPYLFILCGEMFSALINRSIASKALSGIKIARNAPVISHLLFADDSILFGRAPVQEAECLKEILVTYERASGQVVNLDKSMLSVSRNVQQTSFDELKHLLGVKVVESYDKYLGLPTIIDINSMISNFFWGGDVSQKGMHWTKWNKLCKNKLEGGLGFRDFKAFNIALVAKNWWRIYSNPEALVAQVFKGVYFQSGDMWGAKKGYRPSYAWSSIHKSAWVFQRGGLWRIGNGKRINLWTDNWLPGGAPTLFRQDVVEELNIQVVSNLLEPDTSRWHSELVEHIFHPGTARRIMGVPLATQARDDFLCWPFTMDGSCQNVMVLLSFSFEDKTVHGLIDLWVAVLHDGDADFIGMVQTLCYALWEARNRRSGNAAADCLARNASTYADMVWVDEVPDCVFHVVAQDVLASMPPDA
ncbi:uncharacterized protein LOC130713163 [Lotus japonicus]|uniref:uncharacterized protein LOC130713163 n=1 Tax=Lotus japonicus TaxID=34305 RepID=UPI00258B5DEA|nr:uncharacterized protein LOC130713163 [Lotus japonicus]